MGVQQQALSGSEAGGRRGQNAAFTPEQIINNAQQLRWEIGRDYHEQLMEAIYADAARIADRAVWPGDEKPKFDLDRAIDQIVTNKIWGLPVMLGLFALIFWLTITGANIPSQFLADILL